MSDLNCCVSSCEKELDQKYWDAQYQSNTIGWDLGQVSPPLKKIIDTISDKNSAILIPGGGNSYEAEYLLNQGFKNITVIDIAPTVVSKIQKKFEGNSNLNILLGDFFEHQGQYDYILEQTFFCALPPKMRQKYVWKMHQLLLPKGKIKGLLFNREFETNPPFGGSIDEYSRLFKDSFQINQMEICVDSVSPRANSELEITFKKNTSMVVNLYQFEGISCSGCKNEVSEKISKILGVENVSMNVDFSQILIVSSFEIELKTLQEVIAYEEKYKILNLN